MLESLAGAALFGGVNNMLSEYHADKAHERQLELMEKQNALNRANNLSSYIQQVQGMKMAGLNPAALNGNTNPNVSAAVSQGAAAKGENVEADPMSLMLRAQIENVNADTEKKRAEVGNVREDTDLKFAQKLFAGANTDKVNQETRNIQNVNDTYADTNRALEDFGRGMAEKWQSSEWFNKLSPQTKDTIDAIAAGSTPLTVGGLRALRDVIGSQKELSDADRSLVQNAFDNAITESMFNDKSVMAAISREPKIRQERLKAEIAEINAEIPEVRARIANLLADLEMKKLSREDLRAKIDAFKRNDLSYLKSKGEYGKWFESYAEEMLMRMLPLVTGAAVAKGFASSSKAPESSIVKPNIVDPKVDFARQRHQYHIYGVQDFHW